MMDAGSRRSVRSSGRRSSGRRDKSASTSDADARPRRGASLTESIAYGKVRIEGVVALVFVPAALLLLIWALSLLFRSAPIMALGLSGFSAMVIFELHKSERGHGMVASNADVENRFWAYIVSGVFSTLFFSPDSPAASLGWSYPIEAVILVLTIGMLVYLWDRSHHINYRRQKRPWEAQRRRNSYYLDNQDSAQANVLLENIESLLEQLKFDNPLQLMSKALPRNRRRSIKVQQRILELLQGAKKQHLNFLLSRVNLRTLFHRVKDTDILVGHGAKRNFRSQLLHLLCTDRHGEGLLNVVHTNGGHQSSNTSDDTTVTVVTGGIKTEEEASNPQASAPSQAVSVWQRTVTEDVKSTPSTTSPGVPPAYKDDRLNQEDNSSEQELAPTTRGVEGRLDELDVISKASILASLQEIRLTADPRVEEMVVAVFLSTSSSRLTKLKMMLDHRCSSDCLHKLIYRDIDDPQRRRRILSHFKEQGERLRRERSVREAVLRSKRRRVSSSGEISWNQRVASRHIKILSDIDDTLFSSGGHFPAGIDKSYGKHVLYPGVLSTYRELDHYWRKGKPGNLAFLSARPHVYKGVLEKTAFTRFRELHERGDMHCAPTMLAGALDTGSYLFWGNYEPMARQKFRNFEEFSALWPECSFIFVGDNGQGDVRVGELMLSRQSLTGRKISERVDGVFIHIVQPIELTPGYSPSAAKRWNDLGIIFFKTYVGLAVEACRIGLIPVESIYRIAQAATEEFSRTEFSSERNRTEQRDELNRDMARANDFIHELRQGSFALRHENTSSSVEAPEFTNDNEKSLRGPNLKRIGKRGGFRLAARLVSTLASNRSSTDVYIPYLQKQVPMRFAVGDAVVTCCGEGMPGKIIAGPRRVDGMYTVRLMYAAQNRLTVASASSVYGVTAIDRKVWGSSENLKRQSITSMSSSSSSRESNFSEEFRSKSYLSMSALASSHMRATNTFKETSNVHSSTAVGQSGRASKSNLENGSVENASSGQLSSEQRKALGPIVYAPAAALKRVAMLPSGTPVLTPFGTGIIDEVRAVDGIHCVTMTKIICLDERLTGTAVTSISSNASEIQSVHGHAKETKNISYGAAGAGRDTLIESMNADEDEREDLQRMQSKLNDIVLESKTKRAAAMSRHHILTGRMSGIIHRKSVIKGFMNARDVLTTLSAAVGDSVKTAMGDGLVVDYRPNDNIYVIKLFTRKAAISAVGANQMQRHSQHHNFWSTLYLSGNSRSQASKLQRLPREEITGNRCIIQ